jgi:DNA-binding MarR family transcriptional regulator
LVAPTTAPAKAPSAKRRSAAVDDDGEFAAHGSEAKGSWAAADEKDALLSYLDGLEPIAAKSEAVAISVIAHIQRLARKYDDDGERIARHFGIGRGDLYLLLLLNRTRPHFIARASVLQQALGITSGGLTKRLDRMERDGNVSRMSDPEDGRALLIVLTKKGQALAAAARALRGRGALDFLVDALSTQEWDVLRSLLGKLEHNVASTPAPEAG